jgi:hypothetical protein
MILHLNINGKPVEHQALPGDTLLLALRSLGYFGVKHGCETGECGACAVLLDGKPVNSCVTLAAQAEGHTIETIEAVGEHPDQGWRTTAGLHPSSRLLWRRAPSSAATAPRLRSWQPKSCSSATPIPAKPRCAMRSPGCCAAAPAT